MNKLSLFFCILFVIWAITTYSPLSCAVLGLLLAAILLKVRGGKDV